MMEAGPRRSLVLFLCWVAAVLAAGGFKTWQNYRMVEARKAAQAGMIAQQQANLKFYQGLQRTIRSGKTRAQVEAVLPDPKPVKSGRWTNREDGAVYEHHTYRDPATGGRVLISYRKDGWAGFHPADDYAYTLVPPPMWELGEQLRQRSATPAGWAWAGALFFYMFATRREQRVARAFLLLGIALVFTAAVCSTPWDYWSWWRIRHDEMLIWSAILVVVSLGFVIWAWRHRQVIDPTVCRKCGYDLRATPERCPECGTLVPRRFRRSVYS